MIEATISIEKLLSMKFGPEYQGNYLFGLASVKVRIVIYIYIYMNIG